MHKQIHEPNSMLSSKSNSYHFRSSDSHQSDLRVLK